MNMLTRLLAILIVTTSPHIFAQSLEQLKIAADAGDPVAQDKLATKVDVAQAEILYRKAANKGNVHSQGKLGDLLYLRSQLTIGKKPEAVAAIADEGLQWLILAANQGDKLGQADLARIYFEGKIVKQDYIEAYKWGELSARNPSLEFIVFSGSNFRDAAILKMGADQIAEAKQRVADFIPHIPDKKGMPTPSWVKQIKLSGISGGSTKRFATINNETFEKGESGTVKIGTEKVVIKCLDINESEAVISIEGVEDTQTLTMK